MGRVIGKVKIARNWFLVAAVCNISVLTFLHVLNFLKDLNICESILYFLRIRIILTLPANPAKLLCTLLLNE